MFDNDWRGILSGENTGLTAQMARSVLRVASLPYAAVVTLRNAAYNAGGLRIQRAPVPVIALGNLTTGGTGKTPLAAWLVRELQSFGRQPGLISRGYGAPAGKLNDEALLLAQLCPGVPHVQKRDRWQAVQQLLDGNPCDVIVADDAFQHRRLARDLDLVLIDALNPWGYNALLPRGLLREPKSSLRRGHAVLITRADQSDIASLSQEIRRFTAAPLMHVAFRPEGLINAAGELCDEAASQSARLGVFCGLGNPASFEATASRLGQVVFTRRFPDHHAYTPSDLSALAAAGTRAGVTLWLTSHKDLVKIPHSMLADIPLWAVRWAAVFLSGAAEMRTLLARALG